MVAQGDESAAGRFTGSGHPGCSEHSAANRAQRLRLSEKIRLQATVSPAHHAGEIRVRSVYELLTLSTPRGMMLCRLRGFATVGATQEKNKIPSEIPCLREFGGSTVFDGFDRPQPAAEYRRAGKKGCDTPARSISANSPGGIGFAK